MSASPPETRDRMLLQFYGVSAILFVLIFSTSFLFWKRPGVPAGLAVGYAAGLLPVASWHWVMHFTDSFRRRRLAAVALTLMKYVVLGAGLWLVLRGDRANTLALLAGFSIITVSLFALVAAGLLRPQPNEGKA